MRRFQEFHHCFLFLYSPSLKQFTFIFERSSISVLISVNLNPKAIIFLCACSPITVRGFPHMRNTSLLGSNSQYMISHGINISAGVGNIQCLIEANRETLKSSMTTRKQNAIKSVRRSLAPQPTQDFLHKPTVNHQLISKPPSVPRKVKVELLKREQIRLNEV